MNKNIETEIKKIKNEVSCVKNDGNSIYYSNFKIFKSSSDKLQIKKNDIFEDPFSLNNELNTIISNYNENCFNLSSNTTNLVNEENVSRNIDTIDNLMNNLLSNLVENTQLNKMSNKIDLESQLDILKQMLNYTYLKLSYFNSPGSDKQIINKIFDLMSNVNKQS